VGSRHGVLQRQAAERATRKTAGRHAGRGQGHTQAATASYSHLNSQWKLDSRLAWNEISYSNYETRATAYNARTGVLTRRLDGNVVNNSTLVLGSKLQGDVSLFGQRHQPVIGLDITHARELRADTFRGSASPHPAECQQPGLWRAERSQYQPERNKATTAAPSTPSRCC
jgi:hypothetical protein